MFLVIKTSRLYFLLYITQAEKCCVIFREPDINKKQTILAWNSEKSYTLLPDMILNITAIIAMTSRIWIKPPALYPRKPISHAITKITAMM